MVKREGKHFIGTSGWHYDHWIGPFYPKDIRKTGMLEYFIQHFKTVELNNSFYHLPKKETFENWRDSTPKDFVFAVKASRYITHMKKLKEPKKSLGKFLEATEGLGKKLGPILFQLPPNWKSNPERLDELLKEFPQNLRCTFEFRDTSWFNDEVLGILKKYNASCCLWELKGIESPREITADFVYARMHGPSGEGYAGSYSKKELQGWAKSIREWKRDGLDVYMYFDNDEAGHAAKNARELREMVEK